MPGGKLVRRIHLVLAIVLLAPVARIPVAAGVEEEIDCDALETALDGQNADTSLVTQLALAGYDSQVFLAGSEGCRVDAPTGGSVLWTITSTTCPSASQGSCDPEELPNVCQLIQGALNPWLAPIASDTSDGSNESKIWRVRIAGRGIVEFDDLSPLTIARCTDPSLHASCTEFSETPYEVCFALVGMGTRGTTSGGYPIVDDALDLAGEAPVARVGGKGQRLDLFFDGVTLEFDATDQTKPAVLYQQGHGWLVGFDPGSSTEWQSTIQDSVYEYGQLMLNMKENVANACKICDPEDACMDEAWPIGVTPAMDSATFLESCTSTVGVFTSALLRGDSSALRVKMGGSEDADDIGLLHQHTWGRRREGWRIHGFGTGMSLYGNAIGTIEDFYVSGNHVDFSAGDRVHGADVVLFEDCASGDCSRRSAVLEGLQIHSSVFEGAPYGVMNWFEGGKQNLLVNVSMESGTAERHLFVYGAGSCSNDSTTCASNTDCQGGTCFFANPRGHCEERSQGGWKECFRTDDCGELGRCLQRDSWEELRIIGGKLPADRCEPVDPLTLRACEDVSILDCEKMPCCSVELVGVDEQFAAVPTCAPSGDGCVCDPWHGTVFGGGARGNGVVYLDTNAKWNYSEDTAYAEYPDSSYPFVVEGSPSVWLDVSALTIQESPWDGIETRYPDYGRIVDNGAYTEDFRSSAFDVPAYWAPFTHEDGTSCIDAAPNEVCSVLIPHRTGLARDWWLHKLEISVGPNEVGCEQDLAIVDSATGSAIWSTTLTASETTGGSSVERIIGQRIPDSVERLSITGTKGKGVDCELSAYNGRLHLLPLRYDAL